MCFTYCILTGYIHMHRLISDKIDDKFPLNFKLKTRNYSANRFVYDGIFCGNSYDGIFSSTLPLCIAFIIHIQFIEYHSCFFSIF